MLKRLLVSSQNGILTYIAFLKGKILYNFSIEHGVTDISDIKQYSIFKGIITKVDVSLNAAFVDYGTDKQGFLPFREISPFFFKKRGVNFFNKKVFNNITKGDEVLVQVLKEGKGSKGSLLTTFIRLFGNYLILLPNTANSSGISKKIKGSERNFIQNKLVNFLISKNMSIIVRTTAYKKSFEDLEWDLNILITQWYSIYFVSTHIKIPQLIFCNNFFPACLFFDFFFYDVNEIIVDNFLLFKKIVKYFEMLQPLFLKNIKFYNQESYSLFTYYKVDKQLESVFSRILMLPSGGCITIDYGEALISIDVNSGKFNSMLNLEDTAVRSNLEAVTEIVRQLRLRDLGGLTVVDFIDMSSIKNKNIIEKKILKELEEDKAKIVIGSISQFGLLELSRQRSKKTIFDFSEQLCINCHGKGTIPSFNTLSFIIIQRIKREIYQHAVKSIYIFVAFDFFNFFFFTTQNFFLNIEKYKGVKIILQGDVDLLFPHYKFYVRKEKKNLFLFCTNRILVSQNTIRVASVNVSVEVLSLLVSFYNYIFYSRYFTKFLKILRMLL